MEIRAFGRVERTCDEEGLVQLAEVTFQVSPETLRRIASFLQDAAADLEARGSDFGHRHFRSREKDWSRCDVIVAERTAAQHGPDRGVSSNATASPSRRD